LRSRSFRPGKLDQLYADFVGSSQKREPNTVRCLDWTFLEARAKLLQTSDIGINVVRIEGKMLKTKMRGGIALTQSLVGTGIGDAHQHTTVFSLAAHEAVAKYARLVADDLKSERANPPFRRLAWVQRLNMDVIDPERHESRPLSPRDQLARY
jgi:hypothetical protein